MGHLVQSLPLLFSNKCCPGFENCSCDREATHPSLAAPLALRDDVPGGREHVGAAEVAAAGRLREEAPQVAVSQAVVRRDVVGVPVLL